MAGGAALLPRKRRLVALADNCDAVEQQDEPVLLASCISASSIARSGLLSGIAATDGAAPLPSNLSPADVRLWETAHFVDTDISLGDMVTVVKVAEALGDESVSTWVDKLASQVAATPWSASKQPQDAALCSLLRLPAHLLPAVLSQYLYEHTTERLHPVRGLSKALTRLPVALHPAAFTAAAASGDVSINANVAEKTLQLLLFIPVPPPGLRSLSICVSPRSHLESSAFMKRPSTGATLACAISAHPSLTLLSLTAAPVSPQWLRSFIACLAPGALRHVTVLTLHVTVHPSSCAEVAALLRLLPTLTDLEILFVIQTNKAAVTDEADAVPLSSYASLCGTPATLPHLIRLDYSEWCQGFATGTPKYASATRLLSLLSTPTLSVLRMTTAAPLSVPALQAQLCRFRALKDVSVTGTALPGSWVLPRRFGPEKLPQLERVSITGQCPGSPMAFGAAVADLATSALTSMVVMHEPAGAEGDRPPDSVAKRSRKRGEATSACRHFFEVLAGCQGLSQLTLAGMCGPAEGPDPEVCCSEMAAATPALAALTYLQLQPPNCENVRMELDGHLIGSAIRGLPSLQELSLDDGIGVLKLSPIEAVIDACAELKELPVLELLCGGVTRAHLEGMVPQMDALRQLTLWEYVFCDAFDDVEEFEELFQGVRISLS